MRLLQKQLPLSGMPPLMLFTDPLFLLVFLPVVWGVFLLLQRQQYVSWLAPWLIVASLFFYGWASISYLVLLLGSIAVNAAVAYGIDNAEGRRRTVLTALGVGINILGIGVFKYAAFSVETVNAVTGASFSIPHIVLPLAISFYTFQQIAYLMDVYTGKIKADTSWNYVLFICFFPQLIAGPIVHYKEIAPQLSRGENWRINAQDIALGLTLIVIGLFKKVGIADEMSPTVQAIFGAAEAGQPLNIQTAWLGALAYTTQIYFDFSGYCDMAIGLARLFAVRLPINFNSPYQATSIVEFWRRWHITLSRFLRDYIYIPLGGGRAGKLRQGFNVFLVMVIGGIWHGAGWTFVIWGMLHGIALAVAHVWQNKSGIRLPSVAAWALTMLFVVMSWVVFRAETVAGAGHMLHAMLGGSWGIMDQNKLFSQNSLLFALGALFMAACAPNAYWLLRHYRPVFESIRKLGVRPVMLAQIYWRPTSGWAFLMAAMIFAVVLLADRPKEFLYFQF